MIRGSGSCKCEKELRFKRVKSASESCSVQQTTACFLPNKVEVGCIGSGRPPIMYEVTRLTDTWGFLGPCFAVTSAMACRYSEEGQEGEALEEKSSDPAAAAAGEPQAAAQGDAQAAITEVSSLSKPAAVNPTTRS